MVLPILGAISWVAALLCAVGTAFVWLKTGIFYGPDSNLIYLLSTLGWDQLSLLGVREAVEGAIEHMDHLHETAANAPENTGLQIIIAYLRDWSLVWPLSLFGVYVASTVN